MQSEESRKQKAYLFIKIQAGKNIAVHWHSLVSEVLSIREAVLMVSPKTLNLGTFVPTRPDTHGPEWRPMRTDTGWPL